MTVEDEHKHQVEMTEDAEKGEARQQHEVRTVATPGNMTNGNPIDNLIELTLFLSLDGI
jgi:hypothetical protein